MLDFSKKLDFNAYLNEILNEGFWIINLFTIEEISREELKNKKER